MPEQSHQNQRKQDGWQGQLQVDHAHDDGLESPAVVGCQQAHHAAEHQGQGAGQYAHQQAGAQAVQNGGENVAPRCVGAEPVHIAARSGLTWHQACGGQVQRGLVVGVLRRDKRRQHGCHDDQSNHHQGQHSNPALPVVGPEVGEPAPAIFKDQAH